MHYTADTIKGMAEDMGGGVKVLRLRLQRLDSAWDPTRPQRTIIGPAVIDYTQHADGGWLTVVAPA